ncbi:retinol dehydrogenase 8 [Colletotrichum abscissum]|uniref:Retinol dehydrogenase 8 n=1 Tax=Colletotrichum abscissum TaxID=1671311 RepID=A0A9P9X4M7_9PEZI|nr:retinol dehydrogenase 8 [Colletotrichum abscissum]KAI3536461.1 retinol dehydrogenase 8 [Colletotrichum abscissum]KAK1502824.1 retinol dehydrogenase 8 [Colletotrichum abscissum]
MSHPLVVPDRPLTWFITGCSSGFGLALTRLAQKQGHTVIATSRNPQKTPDLVREVQDGGGRWLPLDVDDLNSGDLITDLEKAGTLIDVLVNNAGWSIHGPAEGFTEEETRAQMDTVFFGPYRLMRAVAPLMRERGSGVIVNISSGAGLEGRESMGVYAAAKAAMDGVSKVLAKEMAPFGVRVLTVALGSFDTNMGPTVRLASKPTPSDYDGSALDAVFKVMAASATEGFPADGDHVKAAKVIYEVITGTGVGEGKEGERMLPLGRDMAKRVDDVVGGWQRTMGVFGDVCNNVYLEK